MEEIKIESAFIVLFEHELELGIDEILSKYKVFSTLVEAQNAMEFDSKIYKIKVEINRFHKE